MTTYRYPIIIPRRLMDKTVGMAVFDGKQFTLDNGKTYPAEALADMRFGAIGYPARALWSFLLFLAVSLGCLLLSALFFMSFPEPLCGKPLSLLPVLSVLSSGYGQPDISSRESICNWSLPTAMPLFCTPPVLFCRY